MRSPTPFLLIAQPILLLVLVRYSASSTCYWPNGYSNENIPCQDTSQGHSACCSKDDACLSNGLCFSHLRLTRGSCTDSTWKDTQCPDYCTRDNENGNKGFIPCGGFIWTCDDKSCHDSNFTLLDGHFVATPASTSASNSVSATPNLSATSIPTSTTNDCTPRLTQDSKVVAVGVGVGVPLAIAVLVVVALFIWNQRLRKELKQRTMTTENGSYMGQTWVNQEEPIPQDFDLQEMAPDRPLPPELSSGRI